MFKINPDPTFVAPVVIPVHGGEPQSLPFVFSHMNAEELENFYKFLESANKKRPRTVRGGLEQDADVLLKFTKGWQEADEEFSKSALISLISNYKGAAKAILSKWESEMHQAAVKN